MLLINIKHKETNMKIAYRVKLTDVVKPHNEAEFAATLGKCIDRRAMAKYKTISQFCKDSGITSTNYARIRSGKHYGSDTRRTAVTHFNISMDSIEQVVKTLDITINDLLDEVRAENPLATVTHQYSAEHYEQTVIHWNAGKQNAKIRLEPKDEKSEMMRNRKKHKSIRKSYPDYLARVILGHMEKRGINRVDLSAMSGIGMTTIYSALPLSNKAIDAPITTYRTIAAALEVEFHLLIEEVEENMSRNLIDAHDLTSIKPFPPLMTTPEEVSDYISPAGKPADTVLEDMYLAGNGQVDKPTLFERALAKLRLKKA